MDNSQQHSPPGGTTRTRPEHDKPRRRLTRLHCSRHCKGPFSPSIILVSRLVTISTLASNPAQPQVGCISTNCHMHKDPGSEILARYDFGSTVFPVPFQLRNPPLPDHSLSDMIPRCKMTFDPLTTTATTLQQLLREGAIKSVQIVERYLLQIERHNHVLNAFISVAPRDRLLDQATALDEERRAHRCRGPLHGIPIVLKVSL